jgi:SNF2 family DNA or RNA helicase
MQWRNEIEAHTDGMKVLVWHGSSRELDTQQLKKNDVVREDIFFWFKNINHVLL